VKPHYIVFILEHIIQSKSEQTLSGTPESPETGLAQEAYASLLAFQMLFSSMVSWLHCNVIMLKFSATF